MKSKKFVSIILTLVIMITLFPKAITVFAHEDVGERSNYLVVAKNYSSYNVINNEFENEICEDRTVSNGSLVLSLTESEAESIEEYVGTEHIEKDIIFKEFGETSPEDIISDFIGGDDDSEEAEEIYPSNIAMVNGDNTAIASEENVVVGILDSGIANHDDLNVTKRICLIPDMYVDNNLFSYDLSGHGTGVAGVIGAKNNDKGIIGIYENVELYSIQVLTPSGEAPLSRIVAGIDWAIENSVDVLNMSFGTDTNSEILYDAIVRATNSGMVIVAAAGNTDYNTQYPAKYNEVISVGSVDGSGNISAFSAKDSFVDIYAPGESVLTTSIINGYTAANGTSLAAPHVTAAAALIKSMNIERTATDIKNLILATANKSVVGNEKGIIDIENMLAYAEDFDYFNNQTTYQNIEPFDEYDQDTMVVGSWWASAHQNITEVVYDEKEAVWEQSIEVKVVPGLEYFQLMIASSYLADSLYGNTVNDVTGNNRKYEFYPLHAYGYKVVTLESGEVTKDYNSNYVAYTRYLYRLARCYMDYDMTDGVEPTSSEILENINRVNEKSQDAHIQQLNNIVRSSSVLYTNEYRYSFGIDDEDGFSAISTEVDTPVKGIIYMDIYNGVNVENKSVARAFKILGLALHLAGDVYAHRAQIPTWSINPGQMFAEDREDLNISYDFNFIHKTNSYTSEQMDRFLRFRDNKSEICTCYDCFRTAVARGRVEFRDIISFHEDNRVLFFKDDNVDFYEGRYNIATKCATERIITRLLEDEDFSIYTFVPTNPGYNLKINNLKGYIIDSGVSFNKLTAANKARIEAFSTSEEI